MCVATHETDCLRRGNLPVQGAGALSLALKRNQNKDHKKTSLARDGKSVSFPVRGYANIGNASSGKRNEPALQSWDGDAPVWDPHTIQHCYGLYLWFGKLAECSKDCDHYDCIFERTIYWWYHCVAWDVCYLNSVRQAISAADVEKIEKHTVY